MDNKFYKGDYVRWLTGHSVYEAHDDKLVGAEPIYRYGIVMEVSKVDPSAIVVHSTPPMREPRLVILSDKLDEIDVLSRGAKTDGE